MPKTGDKYVITLSEEFTGEAGAKLYRVRGFKMLLLGEDVLEQLPKLPSVADLEEAYRRGYEDGVSDGFDRACKLKNRPLQKSSTSEWVKIPDIGPAVLCGQKGK